MIEALTAILVAVTIWYAWSTRQILQANKRAVEGVREQTEALTRPYIVVRPFHTSAAMYYLSVENTGKTAAEDLKLTIDRSFFSYDKDYLNIAEAGLFTTGATSFAPGAQVVYGLGFGGGKFLKNPDPDRMPHQFHVTAEYGFGGKRVSETTAVDIGQFKGMILYASPQEKDLERVRKALESIAEHLKRRRPLLSRAERRGRVAP